MASRMEGHPARADDKVGANDAYGFNADVIGRKPTGILCFALGMRVACSAGLLMMAVHPFSDRMNGL